MGTTQKVLCITISKEKRPTVDYTVERLDKVAFALVQSIIGPILVIIRFTLVAQLIGDGRSRHCNLIRYLRFPCVPHSHWATRKGRMSSHNNTQVTTGLQSCGKRKYADVICFSGNTITHNERQTISLFFVMMLFESQWIVIWYNYYIIGNRPVG